MADANTARIAKSVTNIRCIRTPTTPPPRNLLPEQPPLGAQSIRADVCVIGAGFTGLSTALHLAQARRKGRDSRSPTYRLGRIRTQRRTALRRSAQGRRLARSARRDDAKRARLWDLGEAAKTSGQTADRRTRDRLRSDARHRDRSRTSRAMSPNTTRWPTSSRHSTVVRGCEKIDAQQNARAARHRRVLRRLRRLGRRAPASVESRARRGAALPRTRRADLREHARDRLHRRARTRDGANGQRARHGGSSGARRERPSRQSRAEARRTHHADQQLHHRDANR